MPIVMLHAMATALQQPGMRGEAHAKRAGSGSAAPDAPRDDSQHGTAYTPDDIPRLFDDPRLTRDGAGGSACRLVGILRGMEKRFGPERVWGTVEGMLRDGKHADDADELAGLFAGNEDADSFHTRYDTLYRLCADDGVDVGVRSGALPYLSSLAFGGLKDTDPCVSLYREVENPDMREELSYAAITDALAAAHMPRFRPLLRGICLLESRRTDYTKILSSALDSARSHGKARVLECVRFVAGHECLPARNRRAAERLLREVENADV